VNWAKNGRRTEDVSGRWRWRGRRWTMPGRSAAGCAFSPHHLEQRGGVGMCVGRREKRKIAFCWNAIAHLHRAVSRVLCASAVKKTAVFWRLMGAADIWQRNRAKSMKAESKMKQHEKTVQQRLAPAAAAKSGAVAALALKRQVQPSKKQNN